MRVEKPIVFVFPRMKIIIRDNFLCIFDVLIGAGIVIFQTNVWLDW